MYSECVVSLEQSLWAPLNTIHNSFIHIQRVSREQHCSCSKRWDCVAFKQLVHEWVIMLQLKCPTIMHYIHLGMCSCVGGEIKEGCVVQAEGVVLKAEGVCISNRGCVGIDHHV